MYRSAANVKTSTLHINWDKIKSVDLWRTQPERKENGDENRRLKKKKKKEETVLWALETTKNKRVAQLGEKLMTKVDVNDIKIRG